MATLITKTADTTPSSDDITYTVNDPAGTPADRKVTLGNLVTKAHGLADGVIKVVSGAMTSDSSGLDVADGGTGATSAADARTNLGAQAQDATLDTLAALSLVQGDLLYATAADTLTRLAKGSASQQLRMNSGATAPEWVTAGATGQTLYDRVVAASGGDHTTLGAAITAASAGETIFVRSGTYSESAITSSLANLTIIGENPETTLFSAGANALTFSGARVRIINCGMTFTTGGLTLSGNYSEFQNGIITRTGQAQMLTLSGSFTAVRESMLFDANASTPNTQCVSMSTQYARMVNCYSECKIASGAAQWINCSGNYTSIIGSTFRTVNNISGSTIIASNGNYNKFVGNTIVDSDNLSTIFGLAANAYALVSDNYVQGGATFLDATSAGNAVISGNQFVTNLGAAKAIVAPRQVVVTGNRFITTSGSGTQTGIALSTSNANGSIITGNFLGGFATGISVASTTSNAIISGNDLRTILTTPMTDAGVATMSQNNMGANTLLDTKVVLMKNTSGSTINAGNLVTFKSVAAGDEVTTTTSGGDNKVFGVATAAITNNAYGYIQVLGKTTLLTVNGTTDIAVGDYLSAYTSAGIAQKASAGQMAIAIALEAYTTDDSSGVIDALIVTPRLI